jgi:DNA-binding transcriptional regulator YhcF (GntR family)
MGQNIMSGAWPEEKRIPSVREFAMEMEINPNTVLRAYEALQKIGVIESRRGVGYFVTENAVENIRNQHRTEFVRDELPELFNRMALLRVSIDEVVEQYKHYHDREHKNKNEDENKH